MAGLLKKRSKKAGLPPGTLVYIGDKDSKKNVKISVIDYDEKKITEKAVKSVEECAAFKSKPTVTWINIDGIHDLKLIEQLGALFGFHPLMLEDIVNTEQRPKMEDYGDQLFLVMKMLSLNDQWEVKTEQISIIVGKNFLITFQETEGDVFGTVRERIRTNPKKRIRTRIRKSGSDYLAYALIDAIVDSYFGILERLGEKIEEIEDKVVKNPNTKLVSEITILKRNMIFLRKSVWPLRELLGTLSRGESSLVRKDTLVYLRDVYDHTIQIIDNIETFRDMLAGMLDIYLSSISNRMNEVMKVLTIISTIFIPLTFIAGVYGMNFHNMPEIDSPWGYTLVILVMLIVAAIMIVYFRRKKWV